MEVLEIELGTMGQAVAAHGLVEMVEAVFLADRILVMTDRPGKVLKDIKIDLDRPRNRLSEDFGKLYMRIRLLFERVVAMDENSVDNDPSF